MFSSVPKSFTLLDGNIIPAVGLGVYRSAPGEETYAAVSSALSIGYRHIDTAQIYRNEADVGRAVADSGIPRSEIFITTKLWLSNWGYQAALDGINESIRLLGTPYIDLLLLHAPGPADTRAETWRALEDSQTAGILKSIGVSNFGIPHLEKLATTAKVIPAVNQIEIHPWCQRPDVTKYCHSRGIIVQAYSPLAKAIKLSDPVVCGIAKENGVTPAQVLIMWSLSKGLVTLPKSVDPSRQAQNLAASSILNLSDENIRLLDTLEEYLITGWDPILNAEV